MEPEFADCNSSSIILKVSQAVVSIYPLIHLLIRTKCFLVMKTLLYNSFFYEALVNVLQFGLTGAYDISCKYTYSTIS